MLDSAVSTGAAVERAAGEDGPSSSLKSDAPVPADLPAPEALILDPVVGKGAAVERAGGAGGEDGSSSSPKSDAPTPADVLAPEALGRAAVVLSLLPCVVVTAFVARGLG